MAGLYQQSTSAKSDYETLQQMKGLSKSKKQSPIHVSYMLLYGFFCLILGMINISGKIFSVGSV